MSGNYDFAIVGAGIIGLATAYKLQRAFPEASIAILEKEDRIGVHQTGRNSGVIHSGIYYTPGSYKAKNCRIGRDQLVDYAREFEIPYEECGKIIVATNDDEVERLEAIYKRGVENGTSNIRMLSSNEITESEPFVRGVRAIHVPTAGIIDYIVLGKSFADQVLKGNSDNALLLSCAVQEVKARPDSTVLYTNNGSIGAGQVIFCTGLQSDRQASKHGVDGQIKIVGFRGDYYELVPEARHKIKNLVYPVPDPRYPFLGVHFTRMIDGTVECGPNAVFTFKREGYTRTSFDLNDTLEALTYKGTWKLFSKHWRKGLDEYRRAFSKRLFVKALRAMMPSLGMDEVQPVRSGVRAQAIDPKGQLVDDFRIEHHMNNVHVLNAPSPAATACLAIADEIVSRVKRKRHEMVSA
jgi:L-2-hydroxyglutarate oxidase